MLLPYTGANGPIYPSQVVLPSLFDACTHPDVLLPLLNANLLSAHLRELRDRAIEDAARGPAQAQDDLPPVLRHLQREIDRHFEHLSPIRTAEIFGEIDLDEEETRLGHEDMARALHRILEALAWRRDLGTLDPAIVAHIDAMVARRRFPAYHYASFDVLRAHRRTEHKRRHAPLGLTSCLDEAAMFCALTMTLPPGVVDTAVVLGSPEHYTVFGWSEAGGPWWFYAKNLLLSAREWRAMAETSHGADAQAAFDARFRQFGTITTVDGSFDLTTGRCEIPPERLAAIVAMLERYFGVRLKQLDAALPPREPRPPSRFAPLFRELAGAGSPDAVRERLLRRADPDPDGVAAETLFAYRSLAVEDLAPYLEAARRSPACIKAARDLASIDQALEIVRGIEGRESIFADRERIAMPEETLRLRTGSDRDLALLLHVLAEGVPLLAGARDGIETWFGGDEGYVTGPGFCVSLREMARVDPATMPPRETMRRLGGKP